MSKRPVTAHALALAALATAVMACEVEPQTFSTPPDPETPPVTQRATPALSGGTLAVSPDARVAVAGDPDRDQVYVVDLTTSALRHTVRVPGSEPGRVALSESTAYVALRRGGAFLTIDLNTGASAQHASCASPRGVAVNGERVYIACADGDFMTHDAITGEVVRRASLDNDLRDVVVSEGRVYVSRFRSAEVLRLDAEGNVERRMRPAGRVDAQSGDTVTEPSVAWRMTPHSGGGVTLLHQQASLRPVELGSEGGYGVSDAPCTGGIVSGEVTVFDAEGAAAPLARIMSPVTIDASVNADSDIIDFAAPGVDTRDQGGNFSRGWMRAATQPDDVVCVGLDTHWQARPAMLPEVTSVARAADETLFMLSREPAALLDAQGHVLVELDATSVADPAHTQFHRVTAARIACASCHPEAGDDGHTWAFAGQGLRRTQFLAGGLKGTAPFHWTGELSSFVDLMHEVGQRRMRGEETTDAEAAKLLDWIDAQPAPTAPAVDAERAARGRAHFESAAVGCAGCHAGERGTDNKSYDVGTGITLQTPPLRGLATRTRFMHDGCAGELTDRFDPACGGDSHGNIDALDANELGDLVEYLRSR